MITILEQTKEGSFVLVDRDIAVPNYDLGMTIGFNYDEKTNSYLEGVIISRYIQETEKEVLIDYEVYVESLNDVRTVVEEDVQYYYPEVDSGSST